MLKYPRLIIDLKKLEHNIKELKSFCGKDSIDVAGVIKGFNGSLDMALKYDEMGLPIIASSRLEHLEPLKGKVKAKLMTIRIPMLSEISDVIRITDISLNSEIEVLKALNKEALKQDKTHDVILMKDLGDLREGFWDEHEIIEAALLVENELSNLNLLGIGTNLGCYGSIVPTVDKLNELVYVAEKIEDKIGRKLQYISGGATSSLPRLFEGNMPKRINMLRVGEAIIFPEVIKDDWNCDASFMEKEVFKLQTEVVEIKIKPSYPVGETYIDAFGNKPVYEDIGNRKRALVALGKVDYAFLDKLQLLEEEAFIVGASSDHTIIDITDAKRDIYVGDIIEFGLCYQTLVYLTNSDNVNKVFIK
ncbi:MAG: alanine racemase [Bacilli bacterium]|nr:alanine racemase [Bacilli bacterium]